MTRENAGKTWLPQERIALLEAFDTGASLEALANAHGRTAGAILGKLMEHGRLQQHRNGFYYKINPDPWCNYQDARIIDGTASK